MNEIRESGPVDRVCGVSDEGERVRVSTTKSLIRKTTNAERRRNVGLGVSVRFGFGGFWRGAPRRARAARGRRRARAQVRQGARGALV